MKRLLIITLGLFLFSCSENNNVMETIQPEEPKDLFFIDGVEVDHSEIFNNSSLVCYGVASENGISVTTYAFSTEVKEKEWLKQQSFGQEILESIQVVEELKDLAQKTGAIEQYEKDGTLAEEYKNEMNKVLSNYERLKSTASLGTFYKDVFFGASRPAATYLFFDNSWDNAITSARYIGVGVHFYDKSFFRKRFYTWIPATFVHGFEIHFAKSGWDNITSSVFVF